MRIKFLITVLVAFSTASFSFCQNVYKIPSENWGLAIDLNGYKITEKGFSPDSTMFQLSAINEKLNINLSIFIEKVNLKGDKIACRNYYWSKAEKSPLAKEHVEKYETENLAIVEHDTKEYNGQIINFHSLNAYLVHNGYWMDVHISKVLYSKPDHQLFDTIVKSISIKTEK